MTRAHEPGAEDATLTIVPHLNNGRLVAVIAVHHQHSPPKPQHVALLEAAAFRIFSAVERAEVERALRMREAELRRVQEIGGVAGVNVDLTSEFTRLRSPEYVRLHGLLPCNTVETHADWLRRIVPEDREAADRTFRNAIFGGGGQYISEYRIVRQTDGEIRTISAKAEIDRDADGRALRLVGTHIGVTERKRVEQALRESKARFRYIADSVPVMIWMPDDVKGGVWFNKAWLRVTVRTLSEECGSGWLDRVHAEDLHLIDTVCGGAFERKEPFQLDFRLRGADGSYRIIDDFGVPRFAQDGSFLGFIGSAFDVTDERKRERRLRESERRFRDLANGVPAIVWIASASGDIQFLNDRWQEYTGQPTEEALAEGWAALLHPEDAGRTFAAWKKSLATGESYEVEMRYRRRDRVYRWYVARAEPIRDEDGRITGWLGTSTDIEENKAAEAALARLNETLEEKVRARTDELVKAEAALRQSQKMDALG